MKQLLEREFEVHKKLNFKTIDDVVSFLKDNGIELQELDYLGKGHFGQAFYEPKSNQVIKITSDEQEIVFYLSHQDLNLKYLVEVKRTFAFMNNPVKGIIVLEPLEPLDKGLFSDLISAQDLFNEISVHYQESSPQLINRDINWLREIFSGDSNNYQLFLESVSEIRKELGDRIIVSMLLASEYTNEAVAKNDIKLFINIFINYRKFFKDFVNMLEEFRQQQVFSQDIKPDHIMYSKKDRIYKLIDPR